MRAYLNSDQARVILVGSTHGGSLHFGIATEILKGLNVLSSSCEIWLTFKQACAVP